MTHCRPTSRRALLAAAVTTALVTVMVGPTAAHAAPAPDGTSQVGPELHGIPVRAGIGSVRAERLAGELGPERTAGAYFDQRTGRMVVTVTDAEGERAVTAAGGLAKRVRYSTEELTAVTDALNARIDTRGTTWGTEVDDNRINVTADSTVSDADFAEMRAVLAPYGDAAVLTRVPGELVLNGTVNGGKYIRSEHGYQCSAGFNVQKKSDNSQKFLLTAGHCTTHDPGVSDWYNGANEYFGYDAGGRFPGTDYGLIRHNNASVSKPGNVYIASGAQDITHSRDPELGEAVCRGGYKTGVQCGTVHELDMTVNYPDGAVHGLFRTDICSESGDSGGPVWRNTAALGIHSGSRSSGCVSYHQRVNPALAWYGVEVY
ncbi:S1 family peptidase [Micromonospora sp. KC723]|uniref:S1 family peptidase n=1 Tax=Micromonospora sp. KC723 TaxID=2530381 RepID=UPI001044EBA8|nr:S1 family peptidase [Micromonospora sp. KC723]TDB76268.1 S1 family peptidase [Micromonospora sp. KC723]